MPKFAIHYQGRVEKAYEIDAVSEQAAAEGAAFRLGYRNVTVEKVNPGPDYVAGAPGAVSFALVSKATRELRFYVDVAPILPERSAETTNALVGQADTLRGLIAQAYDADSLAAVVGTLDFVTALWNTLAYAYKVRDVRLTARNRAEQLLTDEEEFLAHERRNSKVRASTEANIGRLKTLITYLA